MQRPRSRERLAPSKKCQSKTIAPTVMFSWRELSTYVHLCPFRSRLAQEARDSCMCCLNNRRQAASPILSICGALPDIGARRLDSNKKTRKVNGATPVLIPQDPNRLSRRRIQRLRVYYARSQTELPPPAFRRILPLLSPIRDTRSAPSLESLDRLGKHREGIAADALATSEDGGDVAEHAERD